MKKYLKILFTLLILRSIISCGGSNLGLNPPPADPVKAQEIIDSGWLEYEKTQYASAISLFNEARGVDPSILDIYNGLGWSFFQTHNLIVSLSNFATAIDPDSSFADAMVGYSISAFEKNEYDQVILVVNTITRIDSSKFDSKGTDEYVFIHDVFVTSRKVRKVLALSYYYSGKFNEAYDQLINFLDPLSSVSPESETFLMDLLKALGKI